MRSGLISSLCSSSITTRNGNWSLSSPANWYWTNPTLASRSRLLFLRFNRLSPPLLHNCPEYINSSWTRLFLIGSSALQWRGTVAPLQLITERESGVGGAKAVTKHGSLFSFTVSYYNTQTQQSSGLLLIHFTCSHINTNNMQFVHVEKNNHWILTLQVIHQNFTEERRRSQTWLSGICLNKSFTTGQAVTSLALNFTLDINKQIIKPIMFVCHWWVIELAPESKPASEDFLLKSHRAQL